MPVMSCDGLSFSGIAWTFKLLPGKHKSPAYGKLGHPPRHFRDQHMV
jgi:hypothetical protein